MLIALTAEGGLLVLAVLLGLATGERFWHRTNLSLGGVALGILLTPPLAVGVAWAAGPRGPFRRLRDDIAPILVLFRRCSVFDFAPISLFAGLGEEALFRGVLQPYIASHVGAPASLVITATLFGLAHPMSRVYVLFASLIGLYLGAVAIWSDDLTVPITIHALYDFLALVYLARWRGTR